VGFVRLKSPARAAVSLAAQWGIPLNRFARVMDATQKERCPFPDWANKAEEGGMRQFAPVTRDRAYPPFGASVALTNLDVNDPNNAADVGVQVGDDAFQTHAGEDPGILDAAANLIQTRYQPSRADFLQNSAFLYKRVIDTDRSGAPLIDENGRRSPVRWMQAHGGATLLVECGCRTARKARLLYPGQTPLDFRLV